MTFLMDAVGLERTTFRLEKIMSANQRRELCPGATVGTGCAGASFPLGRPTMGLGAEVISER
jgi:hypothetical protein